MIPSPVLIPDPISGELNFAEKNNFNYILEPSCLF